MLSDNQIYQNENEAPRARGLRSKGSQKGFAAPKRALQDISNATTHSGPTLAGKKQQTSLPPASSRVSARRSLAGCDASGRYGLRSDSTVRDSLDAGLADMAISGAVKNIDAGDEQDPRCVAEYIKDIYDHLRATETKYLASPDYMRAQTDINEKMRSILIDWLVDVHLKFKLLPETMYLTVNIIDRFLSLKHVVRKKLQLVGVTAMLLASKYEEIYAPEVKDFVYISDKAYTRDEILKMETLMLNTLRWHLTVPSAHTFAKRFIKAADLPGDNTFMNLTTYAVELTLPEYSMIKYLPSMVAASAAYISLGILGRGAWSATLQSYTNYSESALKNCVADMTAIMRKQQAPSPQLQAVKKKYSSIKFSEVAMIPMSS